MPVSRRTFVRAGLFAAAGVLSGQGVARAAGGGLRITRHRVQWPVDHPMRIAHVTDVHVGWATPDRMLKEVVDAVCKARPHLVLLTGDYVNHSLRHIAGVQRFVSALPKPLVATLGNHDHWSGEGGVTDALRRGGAEVLSNRHLTFGALPIVGVDDGFTKHDDVDRALAGVDPDRALVMSHFPNTADHIALAGGRLILSGHTHGGQIVIPGVTRTLARLGGARYLSGWYSVGRARLYVNAGCGHSIEGFRAGESARAEVAIFDLQPARLSAA